MRSECLRTYGYKDFIIILFFRIHAITQAEQYSNIVADDAFIEKSVRWAQCAMLLHGHPHVRMYPYLLLLGAYTYHSYIRVYARISKLMLIYARTFPVTCFLILFLNRLSSEVEVASSSAASRTAACAPSRSARRP